MNGQTDEIEVSLGLVDNFKYVELTTHEKCYIELKINNRIAKYSPEVELYSFFKRKANIFYNKNIFFAKVYHSLLTYGCEC